MASNNAGRPLIGSRIKVNFEDSQPRGHVFGHIIKRMTGPLRDDYYLLKVQTPIRVLNRSSPNNLITHLIVMNYFDSEVMEDVLRREIAVRVGVITDPQVIGQDTIHAGQAIDCWRGDAVLAD